MYLYTECNMKFDLEFQNNLWIYFLNFFTTWYKQSLIIILWQTNFLSFKSRHKAVGENAIPNTKSEEKTLSNVWNFSKTSENDIWYVRFPFVSTCNVY